MNQAPLRLMDFIFSCVELWAHKHIPLNMLPFTQWVWVASLVVGRGWRILAQVQGAVEGRRQEAMTSASLRPPLKDQE